jgi:hypothetical protein
MSMPEAMWPGRGTMSAGVTMRRRDADETADRTDREDQTRGRSELRACNHEVEHARLP